MSNESNAGFNLKTLIILQHCKMTIISKTTCILNPQTSSHSQVLALDFLCLGWSQKKVAFSPLHIVSLLKGHKGTKLWHIICRWHLAVNVHQWTERISEFPFYCLTMPESGKDILKPHLSCSQESYKNFEVWIV